MVPKLWFESRPPWRGEEKGEGERKRRTGLLTFMSGILVTGKQEQGKAEDTGGEGGSLAQLD